MKKKIKLPPSPGNPKAQELETDAPIVIVGANGSGKTRLGTWIEMENLGTCHRIAAQKSLTIPESISPTDTVQAETDLIFGHPKSKNNKMIHRWGSNPSTTLLNDFQKLLVLLASEDTEISYGFRQAHRGDKHDGGPTPESKLDRIKALWEDLLPRRSLKIQEAGKKIMVCPRDNPSAIYHGSEMSDGERVMFYLIGQALCAPENAIIVIDEPELHLHKAIQGQLWDEIERAREDCLFVYLTHDLSFATSRKGAKRIWLKDYSHENMWDWKLIPDDNAVPEEMYLKVLGDRRSVLFVEGEPESLDYTIYSLAYPDLMVAPVGSCERVIRITRAFNHQKEFHNIEAYGLIDRDHRDPGEIESLKGDRVHVLNVAHVENLLLLREVLLEVAAAVGHDKATEFVNEAQRLVLGKFQKAKERHVAAATERDVRRRLCAFKLTEYGRKEISAALATHAASVKSDDVYDHVMEEAKALLTSRDYNGVLKVFRQKGLIHEVQAALDLSGDRYVRIVGKLMRQGNEAVTKAIQGALPSLPPSPDQ